MFYLPSCRKCRYMKPKYLQAANKLVEEGSKIKMAQCNARENRAIASKLDIRVAPYVKLFNTNYEIEEDEQKAIRNSVKPILALAEKCLIHADNCSEKELTQ